MTLALHLPTQIWPMLDLVLAIFQPAVILLLCAGFVVASIHLLSMFSTRWGDKRVSTKALFFSVGLHATLLCGVIAMIPEYRPRVVVTSFLPEDGVQVDSIADAVQTEFEAAQAGVSGRPIWDKVNAKVTFDAPRRSVPATPIKPSELAHVETSRPDQTISLPEPVHNEAAPTPQEMTAPPPSPLVEALPSEQPQPVSREVPLDEVVLGDPQTESPVPPQIVRSSIGSRAKPIESSVARTDRQPVDRIREDFDPEQATRSIAAMAEPEATLPQGPLSEEITPSEGPAPYQIPLDPGVAAEAAPPNAAVPSMARSIPRSIPSSLPSEMSRLNTPRPRPAVPRNQNSNDTGDAPELLGSAETPPLLMRPELSPAALVNNSTPAQYILRNSTNRGQAVEQFGGTAESEAAVDLALKWLASIQESNGSFDGDSQGAGRLAIDANAERDGRDADAGLTALAVLAFLGKQHTLEEGEYSANVEKALRWLISQQGQNSQGVAGYLGGQKSSSIAGMYSHALATFAMAEAYAMTKDETRSEFLKIPLQRAVAFTLECQLEDGGWRYMKLQLDGGDMSIFGWQLMSLKSAQAAGLDIPLEVRQKMILFLQNRGIGKAGGLAAYRLFQQMPEANRYPSVAMTAESLFCKQMLGIKREHPSCTEAVDFILANPPMRSKADLYSWYYSTLALYQYGGEPWEKWNVRMRDLLINEQTTTGPDAGSWEPRDRWGDVGGRIYSTAFATLTLEVYYRYLPLYRLSAPAETPTPGTPREAEPMLETAPVLEK